MLASEFKVASGVINFSHESIRFLQIGVMPMSLEKVLMTEVTIDGASSSILMLPFSI